jgi:uncharacterized protein (DUF58 family)
MKKRWYSADALVIIVGLILRENLILIVGLLGLLVLLTIDIWAKYCLHQLRFQRHLSENCTLFGEEITLSISIENAKMLPLPWLEIEDKVPSMLRVQGRRLRVDRSTNRATLESLFSPRWYERITRRYSVSCNARGVHAFGPTLLRSSDLFGFVERQDTLQNKQYLVVYPLIAPLSSFNLPARHPFGDRRAPRRLLEDPSRVVGIRDYTYGDDLRRVHWKATARTMQLQSKIYEATITYTLVLFLNVAIQIDSYFGFHPELQELAICAAASVANWALNAGYAVGLYANSIATISEGSGIQVPTSDEQEKLTEGNISEQIRLRRIRVVPTNDQDQRRRIMDTLARIQGSSGDSVEDLIQAERSRLPAGATIVIVTNKITEPLLDALTNLRYIGHAVTILQVGDQPVVHRMAGISVYPLGGEETWKKLSTTYDSLKDADAPEPQVRLDQDAVFHL